MRHVSFRAHVKIASVSYRIVLKFLLYAHNYVLLILLKRINGRSIDWPRERVRRGARSSWTVPLRRCSSPAVLPSPGETTTTQTAHRCPVTTTRQPRRQPCTRPPSSHAYCFRLPKQDSNAGNSRVAVRIERRRQKISKAISALPVIAEARRRGCVCLARYDFLLVFHSDLRSRWNRCRVISRSIQ